MKPQFNQNFKRFGGFLVQKVFDSDFSPSLPIRISKRNRKLKINCSLKRKKTWISNSYSDKALKCTVVNRALPSLHHDHDANTYEGYLKLRLQSLCKDCTTDYTDCSYILPGKAEQAYSVTARHATVFWLTSHGQLLHLGVTTFKEILQFQT